MYDITSAVSLWEHLAVTSKPIIIYGMGDGAQKILDVCAEKNVKISGFIFSGTENFTAPLPEPVCQRFV